MAHAWTGVSVGWAVPVGFHPVRLGRVLRPGPSACTRKRSDAAATSGTPWPRSSTSSSSRLPAAPGWRARSRTASDTGSGWAFTRIRQSLEDAKVRREPPWVSLGARGRRARGARRERQSRGEGGSQGPRLPRREGRLHPESPAGGGGDGGPVRHRADEPAGGPAVRRIPDLRRIPGGRSRVGGLLRSARKEVPVCQSWRGSERSWGYFVTD
jgi:hypothetical protein